MCCQSLFTDISYKPMSIAIGYNSYCVFFHGRPCPVILWPDLQMDCDSVGSVFSRLGKHPLVPLCLIPVWVSARRTLDLFLPSRRSPSHTAPHSFFYCELHAVSMHPNPLSSPCSLTLGPLLPPSGIRSRASWTRTKTCSSRTSSV